MYLSNSLTNQSIENGNNSQLFTGDTVIQETAVWNSCYVLDSLKDVKFALGKPHHDICGDIFFLPTNPKVNVFFHDEYFILSEIEE